MRIVPNDLVKVVRFAQTRDCMTCQTVGKNVEILLVKEFAIAESIRSKSMKLHELHNQATILFIHLLG